MEGWRVEGGGVIVDVILFLFVLGTNGCMQLVVMAPKNLQYTFDSEATMQSIMPSRLSISLAQLLGEAIVHTAIISFLRPVIAGASGAELCGQHRAGHSVVAAVWRTFPIEEILADLPPL